MNPAVASAATTRAAARLGEAGGVSLRHVRQRFMTARRSSGASVQLFFHVAA